MSRPRILVLGDTMIDHNIYGFSTRLAAEGPVPVVDVSSEEYRLGGAANLAGNLAVSPTYQTTLLSVIGHRRLKTRVEKLLADSGIDRTGLLISDRPTTEKVRLYIEGKLISRHDFETREPISAEEERQLIDRFSALRSESAALVISDYRKGVVTPELCRAVIASAREVGMPVYVDPRPEDAEKYRGCTYFKPNLRELTTIADTDDLETAIERVQRLIEPEYLLLTKAAAGIALYRRGHHLRDSKPHPVEVLDVTGAGATVLSVFVLDTLSGRSPEETVTHCQRIAEQSISHLGVYRVTSLDLSEKRVYRLETADELRSVIEGQTSVFTNGCFDLLHRGHIESLRYCRSLGSPVILALNSDASIRRRKGLTRPVNSFDDRLFMLQSLKLVDYFFVFDTEKELKAILERLRPTYLVKGSEYRGQRVTGEEFVEMRYFDLVPNQSSTSIIDRIRSRDDSFIPSQ